MNPRDGVCGSMNPRDGVCGSIYGPITPSPWILSFRSTKPKNLYIKVFRFQVAVIPSLLGGKLQHTIVRIRHALLIKQFVTGSPYIIFRVLVRQYFHRTDQHYADILNQPCVIEIDAGIRIVHVLFNTHGRRIRRKIKLFQSISLPWFQHCLGIRKTLVVYGTNEAYLLLVNELFDF